MQGTSLRKFYLLQLKSCCDCHMVLILTRRNTCIPRLICVEHSEMLMLREVKERTATPGFGESKESLLQQ